MKIKYFVVKGVLNKHFYGLKRHQDIGWKMRQSCRKKRWLMEKNPGAVKLFRKVLWLSLAMF